MDDAPTTAPNNADGNDNLSGNKVGVDIVPDVNGNSVTLNLCSCAFTCIFTRSNHDAETPATSQAPVVRRRWFRFGASPAAAAAAPTTQPQSTPAAL